MIEDNRQLIDAGDLWESLVSTWAVPRLACGHRHHRLDARRTRRRSVLGYHYLNNDGMKLEHLRGGIKYSQVGHFTYPADP